MAEEKKTPPAFDGKNPPEPPKDANGKPMGPPPGGRPPKPPKDGNPPEPPKDADGNPIAPPDGAPPMPPQGDTAAETEAE